MHEDFQGRRVPIAPFYRSLFRMVMVRVSLESIHTMDTCLRDLVSSHVEYTMNQLRLTGIDERVGRITVTVPPDEVPENGEFISVFQTTPHGEMFLRQGVRVVIVDSHHRHPAIGEMRNVMEAGCNWTSFWCTLLFNMQHAFKLLE